MCFEASIRVEFKIKVIHFAAIYNFVEGIEFIRDSDRKLQSLENKDSSCLQYSNSRRAHVQGCFCHRFDRRMEKLRTRKLEIIISSTSSVHKLFRFERWSGRYGAP